MTIKEKVVVKAYKAFCHYLSKNHIPHIVTIMVDGRVKGHVGSSTKLEQVLMFNSIGRKIVMH